MQCDSPPWTDTPDPDSNAPGPLTLASVLGSDSFNNRDIVIRFLVNCCGSQVPKVAAWFDLTVRRIEQIARTAPASTSAATQAPPPEPMTADEKRDMLDEYERRATTPEGRMQLEVLRDWFNGSTN